MHTKMWFFFGTAPSGSVRHLDVHIARSHKLQMIRSPPSTQEKHHYTFCYQVTLTKIYAGLTWRVLSSTVDSGTKGDVGGDLIIASLLGTRPCVPRGEIAVRFPLPPVDTRADCCLRTMERRWREAGVSDKARWAHAFYI